ncbi:MAG: nucleotide sugar dehydrogenase [Candidatus Bipolaricaulota bacterium]|nr:MAG: nucleotide sugar dehydrogenase [Candidatus Bipolaricaulota bacterium]
MVGGMVETLLERIERREARVAVVGLGYVGLPLAVAIAAAGFPVSGIERNPERVEKIGRGENYVGDVVDGDDLASVVRDGRLTATDRFAPIAAAEIVAICVPTPLDASKQPDTRYVRHVTEQSMPHVHPGQLFVLESTSYPGTTEELLRPAIESTGHIIGEEVFLAFSPERIDPGNRRYTTRNTPRVVGGVTPACTQVAQALYEAVLDSDVVAVSSPRVAEMAKLLENTYRIVNISLVNELALLCERMGLDIWEVIDAASTKPFGYMPFYPGPGLGGHCIPLDPFYLSWKARAYGFSTRFIELAGQINDAMPEHVVERAAELLNRAGKPVRGARILLLGVAYKANVDDVRESPALKIAALLVDRGAALSYHDPHVPRLASHAFDASSEDLSAESLEKADLVLITAAHDGVDYERVVRHAALVFDTRNATRGITAGNVVRLGSGVS